MEEKFKYTVGQLIEHQRYSYRGVVVSRDSSCQASSEWYAGNLTQPAREQPWYHVLVDQAVHTTYVAEQNLGSAEAPQRIVNPMVDRLFSEFDGVRYTLRRQSH